MSHRNLKIKSMLIEENYCMKITNTSSKLDSENIHFFSSPVTNIKYKFLTSDC